MSTSCIRWLGWRWREDPLLNEKSNALIISLISILLSLCSEWVYMHSSTDAPHRTEASCSDRTYSGQLVAAQLQDEFRLPVYELGHSISQLSFFLPWWKAAVFHLSLSPHWWAFHILPPMQYYLPIRVSVTTQWLSIQFRYSPKVRISSELLGVSIYPGSWAS